MEGHKLDYIYARGSKPDFLKPRDFHVLGAGPTNCSERTIKALTYQPMGVVTTQIRQLMADIKEMAQYVFQTKNPLTLCMQASGIGGIESILNSVLDPGEKVIIAIGGFWGELCVEVARRLRLDVKELKLKNHSEPYTLEELETALKIHRPSLLFVTHAETSTGLVQPLEGLGPLCHKYNCLLAVDAVVSLGVEPLFVDRWEIDAVAAATQKGVGAPPGMALLTLSSMAQKKMIEKKEKACYYLDIKSLAGYWECLDGPFTYHSTVSSNLLATTREALAQICEEGVDNVWARHKRFQSRFRDLVEEMGLKIYVEKPEHRFNGVSCVMMPQGISSTEFVDHLERYGVSAIMGIGPLREKMIRVGLLAYNAREEVLSLLVDSIKAGLEHFERIKHEKQNGLAD